MKPLYVNLFGETEKIFFPENPSVWIKYPRYVTYMDDAIYLKKKVQSKVQL